MRIVASPKPLLPSRIGAATCMTLLASSFGSLRVEKQAANALAVAEALEVHPKVTKVLYPWLESHPQHELARRQMLGGGTVVTFEIDGGKAEAFALMNALQVVDISNNLGDAKSMVTHPATTTHRRSRPHWDRGIERVHRGALR